MNEKETGKFIAEIRKQKSMTQRELAEMIGVSDKTISKWETGKSLPDMGYLKNLCDALEVTVNEMIAGQHLSDRDYSQKAEETIMTLMKENENNKTRNHFMSMIGVALVLIAAIFMLANTQSGYAGVLTYSVRYLDIPSLILVALPALGIVLISKKRTYMSVLELLDKILVPIGVVLFLSTFVMVMNTVSDPTALAVNLAVSVIGLIYAVIGKIIVVVLIARSHK